MKKICIVASKYYEDIINMLVSGVNDVLNNHKKKIKTKIIYVPGVFEIPYAISKNLKKYDAFIALGCVIKGETPHFDFISKSSIDAIMKLSITPHGFLIENTSDLKVQISLNQTDTFSLFGTEPHKVDRLGP